MENITFQDLITALVVIFAVFEAINLTGKTIETVKNFKKPQRERDRVQTDEITTINGRLSADKQRLDQLTAEIEVLKASDRVLMQGVKALLEHELHNGNGDEMKEASRAIDTYLLQK